MGLHPSDATAKASNGNDRNALELGFTHQFELSSDRLAMIPFSSLLSLGSQRLQPHA